MRRLSFTILLILFVFLSFSCASRNDNTYISFGEAGVLAAQTETKEAGSIRVPSPAGTKAALCVGWKAEAEGGHVFLPIGATYSYEAGENKSFTPVYLHFTTDSKASLILTDTMDGILFTTTVHKSEWDRLAALAPSLSRGTLVLPAADAQGVGTLTHEALTSMSLPLQFLDMPADAWSAEEESTLTFAAPFTNISVENYATNYTALGYVKITYTDGSERYAYATYESDTAPSVAFYSFPDAVKKHLDLTTMTSGTLDLTAKNGGILFTSSISKAKWNALVNTSGTLTRGTLIFPVADLAEIGGTLTHAALAKAGKTAIDIPSTTWLTGTSDDMLQFAATHTGIAAFERTVHYTAVGYIRIAHTDGTATYIYASFEDNTPPSASVQTLAGTAKHDISNTETDRYKYPVLGGFSPYTEEELTKLDELSKLHVLLVFDESVQGNYRLDDNYLILFTERIIADNDPTCATEWNEIYQTLDDTIYEDGSVLIISAKDGTPLTENNVSAVEINYGMRVGESTEHIFLNGNLIVPYRVYSRPV